MLDLIDRGDLFLVLLLNTVLLSTEVSKAVEVRLNLDLEPVEALLKLTLYVLQSLVTTSVVIVQLTSHLLEDVAGGPRSYLDILFAAGT